MTIQQKRPIVDLIEAHQQLDHRGLAGACRTDDSNFLARARIEGEIVYDDLSGL